MLDYIPTPTIVMFGCQSLDARPTTPRDCPVCKGGIKPGHDTRYCGKCDSLSPAMEKRVKAARLNEGVRDRAGDRDKSYRAHLDGAAGLTLTESEVRRIWNGHGRIHSEDLEPTNRARIGREWLQSLGLAPDWSLVLSRRGGIAPGCRGDVA